MTKLKLKTTVAKHHKKHLEADKKAAVEVLIALRITMELKYGDFLQIIG